MKTEQSASDAVLGCILIVLLFTVSPLVSGFVTSQLWAWFIVPTFNAPTLNIPQAIGLTLIINWLVRDVSKDSDGDKTVLYLFTLWLVKTFGIAAMALLMGMVVKGFLP